MEILKLIGVVTVLLAIAFSGIAIKMFFKKDGKFEKSSCCNTGSETNSCACSVNSDR